MPKLTTALRTIMLALVLDIAGNLLTPPVEEHFGVVGDAVTSRAFPYVAFLALLAAWAATARFVRKADAPVLREPESTDKAATESPEIEPEPDVRFYVDHNALNASDDNIDQEMQSGARLWVCVFVGHYFVVPSNLFEKYPTARIERLLLSDPANELEVKRRVTSFRQDSDVPTYTGQIRETARAAIRAKVPVEWWDGPLLPIVVRNPRAVDTTVRFDIPIPETDGRPSLVFSRHDYPALVEAVERAFDSQWKAALKLTSDGKGNLVVSPPSEPRT